MRSPSASGLSLQLRFSALALLRGPLFELFIPVYVPVEGKREYDCPHESNDLIAFKYSSRLVVQGMPDVNETTEDQIDSSLPFPIPVNEEL